MLFHLPLFPHHIFHSYHNLYILHLPLSLQGKCHLGILPLFNHHIFHSCRHLYLLHLPPYQQEKFHHGILHIFPCRFFIPVIFSITYTFLHINRGSVIWEFCLLSLIVILILVIFSIIYTLLHIIRGSFI